MIEHEANGAMCECARHFGRACEFSSHRDALRRSDWRELRAFDNFHRRRLPESAPQSALRSLFEQDGPVAAGDPHREKHKFLFHRARLRGGNRTDNTTLARDAVQGMAHAQEAGGLSGAPVLEMSNRVITQLRQALGADFPIIGVGGILSAADAVSKIKAGADVVQIYTGLIYRGPRLVGEAARAIRSLRPLRPAAGLCP